MPDALISPTLQLQTNVSESPAPSLSPSSKLDEGYSDDTRSQADKDLGSDNGMALPNWVLALSEAGRAGKMSLYCGDSLSRTERLVMRHCAFPHRFVYPPANPIA